MKVKDVTDIRIYDICYSTYPCQHKCQLIFGSKRKTTIVDAKKIVKTLRYLKWPVPQHLKQYQDVTWDVSDDAPSVDNIMI